MQRTTQALICVVLVGCLIFILALGLVQAHQDKTWDLNHGVGEFQCPNCGSRETHGFYAFWYKDGSLCNGSREYSLDHADHTYFDCDYCGKDWAVYRQEWEALGY